MKSSTALQSFRKSFNSHIPVSPDRLSSLQHLYQIIMYSELKHETPVSIPTTGSGCSDNSKDTRPDVEGWKRKEGHCDTVPLSSCYRFQCIKLQTWSQTSLSVCSLCLEELFGNVNLDRCKSMNTSSFSRVWRAPSPLAMVPVLSCVSNCANLQNI